MAQRQIAELVVGHSHEHLVDRLPGRSQGGIFGGGFAANAGVLRREDHNGGDEQQGDRRPSERLPSDCDGTSG